MLPTAQEVEQSGNPPPGRELAIPEVFEAAVQREHQELAHAGVPPERQLFEQHGGERGHRAVDDRGEKEQLEEAPVQKTQAQRQDDNDVPGDLHEGSQCLEDQMIGNRHQADDAVPRIQRHARVAAQHL